MRSLITLAFFAQQQCAALTAPATRLFDAVVAPTGLKRDAVEALVVDVEAEETGALDTSLLRGDWQLVAQFSTKEATKSQKAFEATKLPQYSNFVTDDKGREVFRNVVNTGRRSKVVADVAWTAPTDAAPRRLGSTICAACVELAYGRRFSWRPLCVPLPLKGEGWLDVTYISDAMRVSRGNRGGLFVHVRPDKVPAVVAAPATRREKTKKRLVNVGSLLFFPALFKSLLVLGVKPPPGAPFDDYVKVWSALLGAPIGLRFFGLVGLVEAAAVLAMRGGNAVASRAGSAVLVAASACAAYTHVCLGQPWIPAAALGALYAATIVL